MILSGISGRGIRLFDLGLKRHDLAFKTGYDLNKIIFCALELITASFHPVYFLLHAWAETGIYRHPNDQCDFGDMPGHWLWDLDR